MSTTNKDIAKIKSIKTLREYLETCRNLVGRPMILFVGMGTYEQEQQKLLERIQVIKSRIEKLGGKLE